MIVVMLLLQFIITVQTMDHYRLVLRSLFKCMYCVFDIKIPVQL